MTVIRRLVHLILRWPVPLVWMALIFVGSSIPNEFAPSQPAIPFDKVAHFGEYSVLAFLLVGVSRSYVRGRARRAAVVGCIVFAAAFGASDEFHQRFVPGRDAGLPDFSADVVGATAGGLATGVLLAVIERDGAGAATRDGSASGRRGP